MRKYHAYGYGYGKGYTNYGYGYRYPNHRYLPQPPKVKFKLPIRSLVANMMAAELILDPLLTMDSYPKKVPLLGLNPSPEGKYPTKTVIEPGSKIVSLLRQHMFKKDRPELATMFAKVARAMRCHYDLSLDRFDYDRWKPWHEKLHQKDELVVLQTLLDGCYKHFKSMSLCGQLLDSYTEAVHEDKPAPPSASSSDDDQASAEGFYTPPNPSPATSPKPDLASDKPVPAEIRQLPAKEKRVIKWDTRAAYLLSKLKPALSNAINVVKEARASTPHKLPAVMSNNLASDQSLGSLDAEAAMVKPSPSRSLTPQPT